MLIEDNCKCLSENGDIDVKSDPPSPLTTTLIAVFTSLWIFCVFYLISADVESNIIYINYEKPIYNVGPYFVSHTLDVDKFLDGFNTRNKKLNNLVSLLGPGYLRIGGNKADQLVFLEKLENNVPEFLEKCEREKFPCLETNYTFTGEDWLTVTDFAQRTQKIIIFDLNVLLRNKNDSWNSANAEKLLAFSQQHLINVHWELGNEPNLFKSKFNRTVNATQLAHDFEYFRKILNKYPLYKNSLLIGPDTTRPTGYNSTSYLFLRKFLSIWHSTVNAISWHQYYLNGRTSTIEDFINPMVFALLEKEIQYVLQIVEQAGITDVPIWIGETGSAYGGGTPELSESYVAIFLWLDKLGMSAKYGMNTVIRQSIFGMNYGLIDANYDPNPDWWISILHRHLIGSRVLACNSSSNARLRFYCHCTAKGGSLSGNQSAITGKLYIHSDSRRELSVSVFGMNINTIAEQVHLHFENYTLELLNSNVWVNEYIITPENGLRSKNLLLNGERLQLTENGSLPEFRARKTKLRLKYVLPKFSVAFFVIQGMDIPACKDEI